MRKYGLVTLETHIDEGTGKSVQVLLNGIDVTRSCQEADDTTGHVLLLCRDEQFHTRVDADGRAHVNADGDLCRRRVRGHVVIQPSAA